MNSYCYIFLCRKKKVGVFRFRSGKWEHIRKDGLDEIPVNDIQEFQGFINWWKEEAAYSEDDGNVDLLFLSDESENEFEKLVQQSFQFEKNSIWSFTRLKEFFRQFDEMEKVDLVVSDNHKAYEVKCLTDRPQRNRSYKFHTFPPLEEVKSEEASVLGENSEDDGNSEYLDNSSQNLMGIARGDGTGEILFRYFKAQVENYGK